MYLIQFGKSVMDDYMHQQIPFAKRHDLCFSGSNQLDNRLYWK